MKKQETVSSWQMATLFLTFITSSSIINIPAPLVGTAKNGAWLSLLLANGLGMLLLLCILYLHRQYPGLTFIDYSRKALGHWLTVVVAIPFLCNSFIILPNIVTDIGGFMTSTMMENTPNYVFHSLILFTAALTARAGIEVMARMFTLLLYLMYGFVILVLLLALNLYQPELLFPVFPDGIKPVLHGIYLTWGFPYSEIALFIMILPFTRKGEEKSLNKQMVYAMIVNAISLLIVIICSTMVLGPLTGIKKYSLFTVARLVDIGDIIKRIESIVGMSLIAGSYMKATIVLFVINLTLSQLFKLRDDRIMTFPIALIALLLSLTMFKNPAEFFESVNVLGPLVNTVVIVLPLIVITLVTLFKGNRAKSTGDNN